MAAEHQENPDRLVSALVTLLQSAGERGHQVLFSDESTTLLRKLRDAAVLFGEGHMLVDITLVNAAVTLHWSRYAHGGGARELAGAVALLLAAGRSGDSIAETLTRLASNASFEAEHDMVVELAAIWQEYGELRIIEAAHILARRLFERLPEGSPAEPPLLCNLGALLCTAGLASDRDDLLEEGIGLLRSGVALVDEDAPAYGSALAGLAAMLLERHDRHPGGDDLDEAIELAGRAAGVPVPDDDPDPGYARAVLGLALRARGRRDASATDHAAAVDHLLSALVHTPDGHPERPARLSNAGLALDGHYTHTGDVRDLLRSIDHTRLALAALPLHHASRGPVLANLCENLLELFRRGRDRKLLDEAIRRGEEALEATAPGQAGRPAIMDVLGRARQTLFEFDGSLAESAEALALLRGAAEAAPAGHDEQARLLANLGLALRVRFERTGDLDELDAAVTAARRSVEASPSSGFARLHRLGQLAGTLLARFVRTSALSDVDKAISLLATIVRNVPDDHQDRLMHLANLGHALVKRWELLKRPEDLDAALSAMQEAIALREPPADSVHDGDRAAVLSLLGATLRMRYEATGAREDLEGAVTVGREAVEAGSAEHPAHAGRLTNLGTTLQLRFMATRDWRDLDEAIEVGGTAALALPADHPDHGPILTNLAHAYRARFEATGDARAGAAAVIAYRRASRVVSAPVAVRLRAAFSWGAVQIVRQQRRPEQARRWDQALAGYEAAVALMPLAAWHGYDPAERMSILAAMGSLGSAAAAVALNAHRPERALELLEQSRGILHAQIMDRRADLAAVTAADAELGARMAEVRAELELLATRSTPHPVGTLMPGPPRTEELGRTAPEDADALRRDRARRLARMWDELLEQARSLPGLSNLLEPPSFTSLKKAAAEGPVVVINVSTLRSDALVVTTDGLRVIPLPLLDPATLERAARAHLHLMHSMRASDRLQGDVREKLSTRLREELAWLWEAVAKPVLRDLGYEARPDGWPRVWWCPTSLLALFPLHAAQRYDHAIAADSGTLDRVISSYTPTVRALAQARDRGTTGGGPSVPLMVALPETPELPRLPHAREEVDVVAAHAGLAPSVLTGDEADHHRVATALARHVWLHFAGHSRHELASPGESCLLLHDGPMTVTDICRLNLPDAEFAYLSSCESGAGDPALPDETLHLAGALMIAGFRDVIAASWTVTDETAPRIAGLVYPRLVTAGRLDGRRSASALHAAQRHARDRLSLLSWAAYTHSGV